jgi:hypothetical protein
MPPAALRLLRCQWIVPWIRPPNRSPGQLSLGEIVSGLSDPQTRLWAAEPAPRHMALDHMPAAPFARSLETALRGTRHRCDEVRHTPKRLHDRRHLAGLRWAGEEGRRVPGVSCPAPPGAA